MTEQPINLKPGNGDTTKQIALRLAALGIFVIVVGGAGLFGTGLYRGTVTVPPETVAIIWGGVGVVLTGTFVAVNTYIQTRGLRISRENAAIEAALLREATAREAERSREEAVRQAAINREHSDKNAQATQIAVAKVVDVVENGLAAKTAGLVKDDAVIAAALLKATAEAEASRTMIADLTAKVETLMRMQTAPHLVLPNGQAVPDPALQTAVDNIVISSAETAINTRDEPEGSAV